MSGLTRARTMPTKRSAPMGTAVRRTGAASKAKGARAKTVGAKRKASVKSKTAKQAYDAATMAVMDMREEKYFHTIGDSTSHPMAPTEGPKRVSVLSFSTTSNLDPADGATVETYCGRQILNLNMLKPYKSDATTAYAPYQIEGKHVFPTTNGVGWAIERNWVNFGPINATPVDGVYGNVPLAGLVEQCPVRCRMIRVTPKIAPGITTSINPTADLFMDQHGLPYSPTAATFTYSDAEFAAVNSRKYTVLQDIKFDLTQPITQQVDFAYDGGVSGAIGKVVRTANGMPSKRLVTRHQLSAKKGGPVYYEQPDAATTVNATTGHRREYIFMHFWYVATDGASATGQKQGMGGTGIVPDEEIVTAHFRVESRFKEA